VELDELDRAVGGQLPGQPGGQEGRARARRPVEDDLLALPEQVGDLLQLGLADEEVGDRFDGHGAEAQRAVLFFDIPNFRR
jgi:hypothetical protein